MIDSLWASPEGLVYPRWADVDEATADKLKGQPCYLGGDYGESRVTTAVYCQREPLGRLVITKEYRWDNYSAPTPRNADAHAAAIKLQAPGPIVHGWIDPSAPTMRDALRKQGIPVSGGYNHADGYDVTDGMLQRGQLAICGVRCPGLKTEIQSLIWDRHGEKPDPNCVDHETDSVRYMAVGLSSFTGVTIIKGGP